MGFAVLPGALLPLEVEALLQELPYLVEGGAVRMEQQSAAARSVVGVLCPMFLHLSARHILFGGLRPVIFTRKNTNDLYILYRVISTCFFWH